jgi:hypothetical protein
MNHKFVILHFGNQCPWIPWTVEQATRAAKQTGSIFEVIDVMKNPGMAVQYRLFCPFMTIIDDSIRLPSPTPAEGLVKIVQEGVTTKLTETKSLSPMREPDRIEPLIIDNMIDTYTLCCPHDPSIDCQAKHSWASQIEDKVKDGILGFIAYQGATSVGAVEFLPASLIPYPIPEKDPSSAVITCIYSQSNGLDYRGPVLNHLIHYLSKNGYTRIQVIAGRRSAYPNGPVSFFTMYGFKEIGEVDRVVLKIGIEEFVLVERRL